MLLITVFEDVYVLHQHLIYENIQQMIRHPKFFSSNQILFKEKKKSDPNLLHDRRVDDFQDQQAD